MKMESEIVKLTGVEKARKRPAVLFGSSSVEGAFETVKSLVNVFAPEAVGGFSDRMEITVCEDNSISILSCDRGLILDETIKDEKPVWYYVFCEMYCGPRGLNENDLLSAAFCKHNDLYGDSEAARSEPNDIDYGFDLCCVQYTADFMHVESSRDGVKKTLDFKKGYWVSGPINEVVSDESNTLIHYLPDPEVFDDVNIPNSFFSELLQTLAITVSGLKCRLKDERDGTDITYHYPCGICDYASEKSELLTPAFVKESTALGKDRYNKREYVAKVELLFAFAKKTRISNAIIITEFSKTAEVIWRRSKKRSPIHSDGNFTVI